MSLRIRRSAFTLVELLVVMAIVVLLATLTLAVVVNMGERDGTTDAAGLTRQWLMIAKNRAARDHANRGLRLVVGMDPNNPAKTNPQWVTELQYIEQPPAFVPSIFNPAARPPYSPLAPCVQIVYNASGNPSECWIDNLEQSDALFLENSIPGGLLVLNDLQNTAGTGPYTGRMQANLGPRTPPNGPGTPGTALGTYRLRVRLDPFPVVPLGAAGTPGVTMPHYLTFNFGITPPPQVIVGEPPLQLPKGICIDLTPDQRPAFSPPGPTPPPPPYLQNPSNPGGVGVDYDILFTPSGTVVPLSAGARADGQIFLWHRDYTKIRDLPSPLIITNSAFTAPFPAPTYDMSPFQNGGEQQIVAIKTKTGGLGQFPVKWPNAAGQYGPGEGPYDFARSGVTAP